MMGHSENAVDPLYLDFIEHYRKWISIYSKAGHPPPDEPVWENGQLHLRSGYPYDGWTSYIITAATGGYNVLAATTERRNTPSESLKGFFSNIDDAGKYVIWNAGENLRVSCRVDPVGGACEDMGLDPRVEQISVDKYVSKYILKSDPSRYFVLQAGGVQPENRLLPLTYEELDGILTADLPEA
jgi:hypothetical protein